MFSLLHQCSLLDLENKLPKTQLTKPLRILATNKVYHFPQVLLLIGPQSFPFPFSEITISNMNMAIIVGKNLHLIYRKETLNLSWDFLFFSEFKLKFVESPFLLYYFLLVTLFTVFFYWQLTSWQLIQPDLESRFIVRSQLDPSIQSSSSPSAGLQVVIQSTHLLKDC